jgi:site-specific recombinase XerD
MGELRSKMQMAMELKNFSKRTITIYQFHMKRFVAHNGKSPKLLGKEEITEYLHFLLRQKISLSGMVQAYSAIKFFYCTVLERPWELDKIPRPKTEKRLPIVLSLKEVRNLLESVGNFKYQTVLMTIYSAGLRLQEGLQLKLKDIDSDRMEIRVEQGKGKKDRYTLLSNVLLKRLREYYKVYKPKDLLFPGKEGNPVCSSTIQRLFQRAKKKPALLNQRPFTHCGIASLLTCWRAAVISLLFNPYLVIPA